MKRFCSELSYTVLPRTVTFFAEVVIKVRFIIFTSRGKNLEVAEENSVERKLICQLKFKKK